MKLRCGKVKMILGAYLDDELSDRKAIKVERHLMECASCSWELKSFQKVNELGQLAADNDMRPTPWEDYMSDLHGKIREMKPDSGTWIAYLYDRLIYQMPDFVTYWSWRLAPGLAIALIIIGVFWSIGHLCDDYAEPAHEVVSSETPDNFENGIEITKVELPQPEAKVKQKEPEPEKVAFNFYLKEHRSAVIQQASYTDQPSQKSIELNDDDVLYYDTMMWVNKGWQGEAGIMLRAPRRNVPAQKVSPTSKPIADSHRLNPEQASKYVSFKAVILQTLYPGYLLESIKKIDGKDCLHLIYTNGIDTLSVFEQSAIGEGKLHSSDLKEYVMYSKEGDDPANIIGWNSDGVSFTVIGNEDFPQLINITREIQNDM